VPVIIDDETLKAAGLTEDEARLELACRLFDIERLGLWPAAKLAGLTKAQIEEELSKRKIHVYYRITPEQLEAEVEALRKMGAGRVSHR
jgi:predicted HTH domain antitoxin